MFNIHTSKTCNTLFIQVVDLYFRRLANNNKVQYCIYTVLKLYNLNAQNLKLLFNTQAIITCNTIFIKIVDLYFRRLENNNKLQYCIYIVLYLYNINAQTLKILFNTHTIITCNTVFIQVVDLYFRRLENINKVQYWIYIVLKLYNLNAQTLKLLFNTQGIITCNTVFIQVVDLYFHRL